MPLSSNVQFSAANQLLPASGYSYDAPGDVLADPLNQYAYDGEGRVCAVRTTGPSYIGYVYDTEGRRVAKGSVTSLSCDMVHNGFAMTRAYLLGPGGEHVTETDGAGNW